MPVLPPSSPHVSWTDQFMEISFGDFLRVVFDLIIAREDVVEFGKFWNSGRLQEAQKQHRQRISTQNVFEEICTHVIKFNRTVILQFLLDQSDFDIKNEVNIFGCVFKSADIFYNPTKAERHNAQECLAIVLRRKDVNPTLALDCVPNPMFENWYPAFEQLFADPRLDVNAMCSYVPDVTSARYKTLSSWGSPALGDWETPKKLSVLARTAVMCDLELVQLLLEHPQIDVNFDKNGEHILFSICNLLDIHTGSNVSNGEVSFDELLLDQRFRLPLRAGDEQELAACLQMVVDQYEREIEENIAFDRSLLDKKYHYHPDAQQRRVILRLSSLLEQYKNDVAEHNSTAVVTKELEHLDTANLRSPMIIESSDFVAKLEHQLATLLEKFEWSIFDEA